MSMLLQKCLNFGCKVAKVVQGSSHDVMVAVAILLIVKSHINDNNIPYTSLLGILEKLLSN